MSLGSKTHRQALTSLSIFLIVHSAMHRRYTLSKIESECFWCSSSRATGDCKSYCRQKCCPIAFDKLRPMLLLCLLVVHIGSGKPSQVARHSSGMARDFCDFVASHKIKFKIAIFKIKATCSKRQRAIPIVFFSPNNLVHYLCHQPRNCFRKRNNVGSSFALKLSSAFMMVDGGFGLSNNF